MNNEWLVYEHLFPNGKSYIGITNNTHNRWGNGNGYKRQQKVWNAIQKYGWENTEHKILFSGLSHEAAKEKEIELIAEKDSICNGYNIQKGGDTGRSTFLSPHIMEMIRYARKNGCYQHLTFADGTIDLCDFVKLSQNNKESAAFWNEAERAITAKYGKQKADREGAMLFWEEMFVYYLIDEQANGVTYDIESTDYRVRRRLAEYGLFNKKDGLFGDDYL